VPVEGENTHLVLSILTREGLQDGRRDREGGDREWARVRERVRERVERRVSIP
jgi:hypothetical protein